MQWNWNIWKFSGWRWSKFFLIERKKFNLVFVFCKSQRLNESGAFGNFRSEDNLNELIFKTEFWNEGKWISE